MFSFPLPQEEKPLLIAKLHWSGYLFVLLKVMAVYALLGTAVTLLLPSWLENKWGRMGAIVFFSVAIIYILINSWKRFLTTYIVTECRLIDITQEKLLRREVTEISLDEVDKIVIKRGNWLDRIFKKGRAVIKLKSNKGILVFYDIKNPEKVEEVLNKIQANINDMVNQEGQECSVIIKDDKTQKVPLSYSYYGDKKENLGKINGDLRIVPKKKK